MLHSGLSEQLSKKTHTEAGSWQVLFDYGDKDSIAWHDLSGKVRMAQSLDDNGKRQLGSKATTVCLLHPCAQTASASA
jgi:hypothetical protein